MEEYPNRMLVFSPNSYKTFKELNPTMDDVSVLKEAARHTRGMEKFDLTEFNQAKKIEGLWYLLC
jgi:hypothetical protein